VTVLDLLLLLSHFPQDAEIAELRQVPETDALLLRVDLPDPSRRRHHAAADWFDDEVTEVDPRRSPFG
jgi:hypothetical protein